MEVNGLCAGPEKVLALMKELWWLNGVDSASRLAFARPDMAQTGDRQFGLGLGLVLGLLLALKQKYQAFHIALFSSPTRKSV